MTSKKYFLLFFICFSSLDIFSEVVNNKQYDFNEDPKNNENDLRTLDIWQFYYGKHLSASEMKGLPNKDKYYISNPRNWMSQELSGKKLPAFGIASYYIQINLKKNHGHHPRMYGLYIGSITSAYKVFINNHLIDEVGKAGTNEKDFRPLNLPRPYYFSTDADSIQIILQVSNFIQSNFGGISRSIYFGKNDIIEQFALRKIMTTCFILCIFVLVFMQQIILSLTDQSEKSHIILAALCAVFFAKLLIDSNSVVIFHFIPDFNIKLSYQISNLALLSVPITLRLIKVSFPNEVNSKIEKGIYVLYALFTSVILISSLKFIIKNSYSFIYISFICVIYIYYVLLKALITKRNYAIVHIISLTTVVSFILYDFIYVTSQHSIGYLSPIGVVIYIIIQSVTLSFKLIKRNRQSLKQSRRLELTNHTLENAVAKRTKDIQATNMELCKINRQQDFLIFTLSHDLMNSFNVLLTFTHLLAKDESLSEKHHNTMQMLYRATENGHSILENILEWTKLHIAYKDDPKPITELQDIINRNLNSQADHIKHKSIKIELEINNSLLFYCHEGHLNAILRNLISNAIKFSYKGGVIKIKNELKNGWVQIIIQDNGVGISNETCEFLFSPTNNKKCLGTEGEKGAGIGLLITKDLVDSNNGQISCCSDTHKGATITVQFRFIKKETML